MRAVDLIRRKREGGRLSREEMGFLVAGASAGTVPDYQLSAWLMAVYFRGLDAEETAELTRAMLHSGEVQARKPGRRRADKHSTGGVGDKTSLIIAPLAAAAGLDVPMISGRGLGHTGGTLDKLESIPGFRTDLPLARFEAIIEECGCSMIGQTAEIAPADRKLYALRDVTATVENRSLITASILSKKLAEGLDALVLDVKVGAGAFLRDPAEARRLAQGMVEIGTGMGVRVEALLTGMEQPLGATVGNGLEALECLEAMAPGGMEGAAGDLIELSLELTARMCALGLGEPLAAARGRLRGLLASGRALEVFQRMARAQGADPRALEPPFALPQAPRQRVVRAERAGYITGLDAFEVGQAAMQLGAGRAALDSVLDPGAGLRLHRKVDGEPVAAGEILCTLYGAEAAGLEAAAARLQAAYRMGDARPLLPPLIYATLGAGSTACA